MRAMFAQEVHEGVVRGREEGTCPAAGAWVAASAGDNDVTDDDRQTHLDHRGGGICVHTSGRCVFEGGSAGRAGSERRPTFQTPVLPSVARRIPIDACRAFVQILLDRRQFRDGYPIPSRKSSAVPVMPRITYIANPHSVHVDYWLQAMKACGLSARIETSMRVTEQVIPDVEVECLVPDWLPGPSVLRYLWAGLVARWKRRDPSEIVQAHCASGNGMVAWLSGHPYIVTTYGSEVLAASQRGPLYRWLLHRVLTGANRLTASSPQMVDVLMREHGIPRERIHLFHMGINAGLFHPPTDSKRHALRAAIGIGDEEPVWISVKRAIPMNRTQEIVEAFGRYCDEYDRGRLVVVCGDDVGSYSDRVKQLAATSPHRDRIIVLDKWVSPPEIARWLQLADFAVSIPTSDQMSNAVLEAMSCGCLPVLLGIDGYRTLKEGGASVHWLDRCTVDSLAASFVATASLPRQALRTEQQAAVAFVREHYGTSKVGEMLRPLYNLPSADLGETRHAA